MRNQWEDVSLRIYIDGEERGVYPSTNISWDDRLEVDEAKYQGEATPRLDATYRGGSGSIEFRQDAEKADILHVYDEQRQHFKDREPGGDVRVVIQRRFPTLEARRFEGVILMASERHAENTPTSTSINFQYENMERI